MSADQFNDTDWLLALAQKFRAANTVAFRIDGGVNQTKMNVARRNLVADALEQAAAKTQIVGVTEI